MLLESLLCYYKVKAYISVFAGGNWPATLALWLVDPLTTTECMMGDEELEVDCYDAALRKVKLNTLIHAKTKSKQLHCTKLEVNT